jgi:hypothetical protein
VFDGINQFNTLSGNVSSFKTPYWPGKLCMLKTPYSGFNVVDNNTQLLQLIKDNNLEPTSIEPKLGYGQVPLRELKNISDFTNDYSQTQSYSQACNYTGVRENLYTRGAEAEFTEILKTLHPYLYNSTPADFLTAEQSEARMRRIQQGMTQDILNFESTEYNEFTVENQTASRAYGETFAFNRRRSLFNLYAFTYQDTAQKNISIDGANPSYNHSLNTGYKVPTLLLRNVEVRNMLYDYQSLVHVEHDNLLYSEDQFG